MAGSRELQAPPTVRNDQPRPVPLPEFTMEWSSCKNSGSHIIVEISYVLPGYGRFMRSHCRFIDPADGVLKRHTTPWHGGCQLPSLTHDANILIAQFRFYWPTRITVTTVLHPKGRDRWASSNGEIWAYVCSPVFFDMMMELENVDVWPWATDADKASVDMSTIRIA